MWQSLKILNVFNTLTLQQVFWKTKAFLKKLDSHFLVECTKIENASFRFETALSEANIKTNRIGSSKWQNEPILKNGVLPLTTLFFWKFCYSLRTYYEELIWCTNYANVHILFVSTGVLFEGFFSVWVSLRNLYKSFLSGRKVCSKG